MVWGGGGPADGTFSIDWSVKFIHEGPLVHPAVDAIFAEDMATFQDLGWLSTRAWGLQPLNDELLNTEQAEHFGWWPLSCPQVCLHFGPENASNGGRVALSRVGWRCLGRGLGL